MSRPMKVHRSARSMTTRSSSTVNLIALECWQEEWEIARATQLLLSVSNMKKDAFATDLHTRRDQGLCGQKAGETARGDAGQGPCGSRGSGHEAEYFIPTEHHNPMELFATTAMWEGGGRGSPFTTRRRECRTCSAIFAACSKKRPDDIRGDLALCRRCVRLGAAATVSGGTRRDGCAEAGALGAAGADPPADVWAGLPAGLHRASGAWRKKRRHAQIGFALKRLP